MTTTEPTLDDLARDLADAAKAAEVEVTTAWKASTQDTSCDCASAEGHGAAADAAQAAGRTAWLYAIGRKAEARRLLAEGWEHHAEADEAVAWLRAQAAPATSV